MLSFLRLGLRFYFPSEKYWDGRHWQEGPHQYKWPGLGSLCFPAGQRLSSTAQRQLDGTTKSGQIYLFDLLRLRLSSPSGEKKISLVDLMSRVEMTENRICELEDRLIEIT